MDRFFLGVDVGTGSARAGLFDASGRMLSSASNKIRRWHPHPHHAEQSSRDIWDAVCKSVRAAVETTEIDPGSILGIGFDATCSLVVLDTDFAPLAVNADGENDRNIISWMDHRATDQAERVNASGAGVLDYVGGRISPEMQTPKLLWLSEHVPDTFARAGHFLDLTDFLTWRATGSLCRSICTVTCKWTYLAHERRWDDSYFHDIGLGSLADEGFVRIGTEMRQPGSALPGGLTNQAAVELGLHPATAVATGLIDAHAGAIGTIGADGLQDRLDARLSYVFGTSACTLNVTTEPAFVGGVWGPYLDALLPDLWLNEGGQSAAGAAIEQLTRLHPFAPEAAAKADVAGISRVKWIEERANDMLADVPLAAALRGLHIVPEFLGNRSPFADPEARAIIAGFGLEDDQDSLVRLYVTGLCSIGYGLRQIIAELNGQGIDISTVIVSGGAASSALVRRCLASAANVPVATVTASEPVLLGSAILGAVASGSKQNLVDAMHSMSQLGERTLPEDTQLHSKRYDAFVKLQSCYRDIRAHQGG